MISLNSEIKCNGTCIRKSQRKMWSRQVLSEPVSLGVNWKDIDLGNGLIREVVLCCGV